MRLYATIAATTLLLYQSCALNVTRSAEDLGTKIRQPPAPIYEPVNRAPSQLPTLRR